MRSVRSAVGPRLRRAAALSILCAFAAAPGGAPLDVVSAAPKADTASRPNIVLVLTDDLDVKLGTLEVVPGFKALFRDQGITFPNSFVSESLCCPSRASIQRGQWVHNHQVVGNKAPEGGFEKFHKLKEEQSTVGTWLHAAGYRTAFLGKYLNGYPDTAEPTFVPPGWDEWASPAKGNAYGEYNYTLNENGSLVSYGSQPDDYLTDVLSRKATRFLQQATSDKRPFFLFVATYAPHQPATPAPRHADAFEGVSAPRPPSYNEDDVSGKPEWIRSKPLLNQRQQLQMDRLYRKRLQSMLAVKELVEQLLKTLRESGHLDDTYLFFASDNGFHLGEHRLHAGKLTAYEEDIRVPLYVRGPGVPARTVREEMVGNIDLAPTFAELAQATVPDFVDGRSLVPLLHGGPRPEPWRGAFLVEQEEVHFGRGKGEHPRQVLEPLDPQEEEMANAPGRGGQGIPAYNALRTTTHTYVSYSTGEHELYDLQSDPHQLKNIAVTADKALLANLDAWLEAFRKCHGVQCRTADVAPPR